MAQLFLADVHSNTGKSTDTIYEIKAPLASFDTIDLDEDTLSAGSIPSETISDLPEKGINELVESGSQESSFDLSEGRNTPVCVTAEILVTDKPNVGNKRVVEPFKVTVVTESDISNALNNEADKVNGETSEQNGDMTEPSPNSSENNASAEEIQSRLKVKGRKHKEKSSSVKYEKIDNFDITDQERCSPMPTLKFKMDHSKAFSTDSDSSDSDNGYIHGGFIATTKGDNRQIKPGPHQYAQNWIGTDSVDSDSTPYSSPKCRRPTIPPPLSKEDAEKLSKKKAYEKRLQRMQVTTNPIERPRSTTPINIFTLDEYASISSPERLSCPNVLEKLKIILPVEETCKSPKRTPRSSAQKSADGSDAFNFSEDALFTHTRSAFLVEDGESRGASPKKILVPPTLSPKLSPARSPLPSRSGSCSPRYYYSPSTKRHGHSRGSSMELTPDFFANHNWANFDRLDNKKENKFNIGNSQADKANIEIGNSNIAKELFIETNEMDEKDSEQTGFCDEIADFDFGKEKDTITEEVLTVKIETQGDVNTCDISCDVVKRNSCELQNNNIRNSCSIEDHQTGRTEVDSTFIKNVGTDDILVTASEKESSENVVNENSHVDSAC